MKHIALISMTLIFVGCSDVHPPTELEGVWRSDLEMTVENFKENEELKPDMVKFLKENLGNLHISFRGNRSKVFFSDVPESEVDSQKFKIISSSEKEITIKINYDIFSGQEFTYHKDGDCMYMAVKGLGYNEYFCRL